MGYHEPTVAQAPKEKMRPKVLHSIEVKHAENGGHILSHRFDNSGPGYGYHETEDHAFGAEEGDKVIAHIAKHMGLSRGKAEEKEEKAEERVSPGIHKKIKKDVKAGMDEESAEEKVDPGIHKRTMKEFQREAGGAKR